MLKREMVYGRAICLIRTKYDVIIDIGFQNGIGHLVLWDCDSVT